MKTKFLYNGIEGTLDLTAVPAQTPGSTTAGNIVVFGDGDGQELDDSGKSFSTDVTLAANSDDLISTQKAVKTYVDSIAAAISAGITFEVPCICSYYRRFDGYVRKWSFWSRSNFN